MCICNCSTSPAVVALRDGSKGVCADGVGARAEGCVCCGVWVGGRWEDENCVLGWNRVLEALGGVGKGGAIHGWVRAGRRLQVRRNLRTPTPTPTPMPTTSFHFASIRSLAPRSAFFCLAFFIIQRLFSGATNDSL
jgi:hypothetical protein